MADTPALSLQRQPRALAQRGGEALLNDPDRETVTDMLRADFSGKSEFEEFRFSRRSTHRNWGFALVVPLALALAAFGILKFKTATASGEVASPSDRDGTPKAVTNEPMHPPLVGKTPEVPPVKVSTPGEVSPVSDPAPLKAKRTGIARSNQGRSLTHRETLARIEKVEAEAKEAQIRVEQAKAEAIEAMACAEEAAAKAVEAKERATTERARANKSIAEAREAEARADEAESDAETAASEALRAEKGAEMAVAMARLVQLAADEASVRVAKENAESVVEHEQVLEQRDAVEAAERVTWQNVEDPTEVQPAAG